MTEDQPFRELFAQLGVEGSGEEAGEDAKAGREELREVVLAHRKRAGNSVVTTIRDVPETRCAELLSTLRKALACGGTVDGGLIVLQGDRRSRLTEWFEKRGVRVRGERG